MADFWHFPDWTADDVDAARRTWMPESGGWMYRMRGGEGTYGHVFVPSLAVWSDSIAASIAANKRAPVAIALDLSGVTRTKQGIPT